MLEEKIRTECPLLGKRVKITSTNRGDLNGRIGVARSFDEAKGRCVVRLGTSDGSLPPRQRSTAGLQPAAITYSPTDLTFNMPSRNVAG